MEKNQIEIYRSADGNIELNVKLENDTVWLTQSQMAELFGVDRTSVVRHIKNIYATQELDESSTCAKNAQVRLEGSRRIVRDIPFYNLDMVISVGYRVNSKNATSFRKMLLYLVVKNHSFSDGNKRIAAMLFLWFMEKNGILYGEDGHKRIADNTLVALTLITPRLLWIFRPSSARSTDSSGALPTARSSMNGKGLHLLCPIRSQRN